MNGPESIFGLFVGLIFFALIIRLVAGGLDRERVRQYFRSRGEELLDMHWSPFGPGWFGEKNDRIYSVQFRDRDGNMHAGHVKTSLMSGVYVTNDHIVGQDEIASASHSTVDLLQPKRETVEQEKARLRKRLAELDDQSDHHG